MARLAVLLSIVTLVAGCQSSAAANVTPLPSGTPHTVVSQTVLQQGDVPAGIPPCGDSGPFTTYLAHLSSASPTLGGRMAAQWSALKREGALDAAISLFAMDPSSCVDELGAYGTARSAASFVVAFADEGEADRAWQSGIFGLAPPAPGEAPPGITRGAGTGLGPSSWIYSVAPVQLAFWRKSVFVALVVFSNLDAASFKAATASVDARLH